MIKLRLLFIAFACALHSYSQEYKTFEIVKGQKLTGVVRTADMPPEAPAFSLMAPGKGARFYTPDSLIRTSTKVARFHVRTEDYAHRDILFVNLITKNQEVFPAKAPLVSAYYIADSATNSWKRFNYNHTTLQPNHVLSVEIDTSHADLYIVLIFPQSFAGKFEFELTTKLKLASSPVRSGFNFNGNLYYHPYDYEKQPEPFLEASVFAKQTEWIQGTIKLSNPAFNEPSVKPGTDSLFFNKLLTNIIALAKEDKITLVCGYEILFQMKFDSQGKLLDVKLLLFEDIDYELKQKLLSDLELIKQVVPRDFTWSPAKNMYNQNVAYTREFLLYMDFCWN